jgi:predicted homoserine dehydrogenase-like protein
MPNRIEESIALVYRTIRSSSITLSCTSWEQGDATVRALRTRHVEAVTTAKIDLKAGTVLDRLGGFHYYGEAEKAHIARAERLLPIGAAEGCRLIRDVPKDTTLTYDDVAVPPGRLVDELLMAQRRSSVGIPPGLMANA